MGGAPLTDIFPEERLAAFRNYLREFAASFGLNNMVFPEWMPNTRRILAAAEYARDQGGLAAFRRAAMTAYWEKGQNLESTDVLSEIAAETGLDAQKTQAATADPQYLQKIDATRIEAQLHGIGGIPTFFIGATRIYGCQPYEVLAEAAARAGAVRHSGKKED